jgi:hypothetical protein
MCDAAHAAYVGPKVALPKRHKMTPSEGGEGRRTMTKATCKTESNRTELKVREPTPTCNDVLDLVRRTLERNKDADNENARLNEVNRTINHEKQTFMRQLSELERENESLRSMVKELEGRVAEAERSKDEMKECAFRAHTQMCGFLMVLRQLFHMFWPLETADEAMTTFMINFKVWSITPECGLSKPN